MDDRPASLEGEGTISQAVSFLYPIGDEAVNTESIYIAVDDITGAVDLSGKAQESPGSVSVSVVFLLIQDVPLHTVLNRK